MTLETLQSALPQWAKDLSDNLSTLTKATSLSEQQQWGALLTSAAASRNESVLIHVAHSAKAHLSEAAFDAALGASAIMAMNNVAYRSREFLGSDYAGENIGLRASIVAASGGVEKADFELWLVVASCVNGCAKCVGAHQASARAAGLSVQQIWDAVRIAATIQGVAQMVAIGEN